MKYRGPFRRTETGGIELEVEHPKHGWIPFHACDMPQFPEDPAHVLYHHLVKTERIED